MSGEGKTKLLRDAEKYVLQGKFSQAISEYQKIAKIDPNDVFTLNTIGDLYLRQGKIAEANKYFSQVAENYTRNNFLLKAIAVYKKILSAEPDDLAINQTLASLYVKQELNADARYQYMRVAEICAREGRTRETREAYEKIAEMDPLNQAVQLKLAEIHLAEGAQDKARLCFAGAARAQAKAGDLASAVNSYRQALQINPLDLEVMRGFLDSCIQSGKVKLALDQLNESLEMAEDNVALHEMVGQAWLAANDPDKAAKAFQTVLSHDDSRYANLLAVSKAFHDAGDYDKATVCLDPVVPILISRRETNRAVDAYGLILQANPMHVLTLSRLASIYSATNDQQRYLEVLDRIVSYHLSRQSPQDALEYLDKILSITPSSEKHLRLHREAYAEAFPGSPYAPPVALREARQPVSSLDIQVSSPREAGTTGEEVTNPGTVEADLLLNYGLRDKAIALLQSLENSDPANKDVRSKLLGIYKEDGNTAKAAEECLLLAALQRDVNNEESAQKHIAEAKKLDPEAVGPRFDLTKYARDHGLDLKLSAPPQAVPTPKPAVELDLSGDLSEIFFKETEADITLEAESSVEPITSEFISETVQESLSDSLPEQLQEVDFYIRLGFVEEARAKLDEIARSHPDEPELRPRYERLNETAAEASPKAAETAAVEIEVPETSEPETLFDESKIDWAIDRMVQHHAEDEQDVGLAISDETRMSEEVPPPAEVRIPQEAPVLEEPLISEGTSAPVETPAPVEVAPPVEIPAPAEIAVSAEAPVPGVQVPQEMPVATEKLAPPVTSASLETPVSMEARAPQETPAPIISPAPGTPLPLSAPSQQAPPLLPQEIPPGPVNVMFADLLDEVNALTDLEIALEEFETHFSMGIAYREMELTEDAIKEFQSAYKVLNSSRFPKEVIQCCGMLSTCFMEKAMPRSALRWCQAGLAVTGISEHEAQALRYDMALAYSSIGDSDRALECFDQIYKTDPNYRDVALKIDSLRGGSDRHAP